MPKRIAIEWLDFQTNKENNIKCIYCTSFIVKGLPSHLILNRSVLGQHDTAPCYLTDFLEGLYFVRIMKSKCAKKTAVAFCDILYWIFKHFLYVNVHFLLKSLFTRFTHYLFANYIFVHLIEINGDELNYCIQFVVRYGN